MIFSRIALTLGGLSLLALSLISCGGGKSANGGGGVPNPPTITSVKVATNATAVFAGQSVQVTVTVQGTGVYSSAVTLTVNGIPGGDALNGTISNGQYIAPSAVPPANPVTITATSLADPSKSGAAAIGVFTISISPVNPSVLYGQTAQFAALVAGITNPVIEWTATQGHIDPTGLYTAPAPGSAASQDTVSASVSGLIGSVSTQVNLQLAPVKFDSMTPDQADVGQAVALATENLYSATHVYFPLPNGSVVAADFTEVSDAEIKAIVPLGAVTGQVYVEYAPAPGTIADTNAVSFTRLPNLHIRAQNKELSAGESVQFNRAFIGGTTTSPIEWTADQGTVTSGGLYTAPNASAETFPTITACITGATACDYVMVHVLPFRIDPPVPAAPLGTTVQLDAKQGDSLLSPTWLLPAGAGEISAQGLFTASTGIAQAGAVPVQANVTGGNQKSSIVVTGGFPGLVNRVWDYLNFNLSFNKPGNLGMDTYSVATRGNLAYCIDFGTPYARVSNYIAIDVYDITNPQQPVWLNAVEAVNVPLYMFVYDHYLFAVEAGYAVPVPSSVTIYDIQNQVPVLLSVVKLPPQAITSVTDGVIYGLGAPVNGQTTVPVYAFDVRSGSVVQHVYNVPPPSGAAGTVNSFQSVTGIGNMIYASQPHPDGIDSGWALDAFDISTSPPTLVTWIPTGDNGFWVRAAGQVVFDDFGVYDFSTATPTLVASFPMLNLASVQGNQVVALGDNSNYLLIDVSNPSKPTLVANVADRGIESPFRTPAGALAGNHFLAADGAGGLAVYDLSAPGGPINEFANPFTEDDNSVLYQVFDQVLPSQTLYAAGVTDSSGGGGLVTFDTSGSQPTPLGRLTYTGEYGLAVQVSGTTAFLGLNDKLKVADVSDPANPVETASVTLPVNALALSGNTLFAGTEDNRLVVFDVSNPVTPNQIASVSIPGPPVTMRISGTLLLVADGPQGLLVFDVSRANSPVLLSQFLLSAPVWDSAPSGTTALLAADILGLVVVDLSNPAQIKQLSQTPLPVTNPFPAYTTIGSSTLALSVSVQNGLGYVGTEITAEGADDSASDSLLAFDISQPASPRLVAFRHQGGFGISVITFSGNNIFLANDGLVVEYDNSLPRNAIELFDPPVAFQWVPPQGKTKTGLRLDKRSRLGHVAKRSRRALRSQSAPVCPVRSLCPDVN